MPAMSMSCMMITERNKQSAIDHDDRTNVQRWTSEAKESVNPEWTHMNVQLLGTAVGDDLTNALAGVDFRRKDKNTAKNRIGIEISVNCWLPEEYRRERGDPLLTIEERRELLRDPRFLTHLTEVSRFLEAEGYTTAVLHMDEGVPHFHAIKLALTENTAKRSRLSKVILNYAAVFGDDERIIKLGRARGERRAQLEQEWGVKYDSSQTSWGRIQTRLWEQLFRDRGYERGEPASITGKVHKTPKQFRVEQAARRAREEIQREIDRINSEAAAEVEAARQASATDVARQTAAIRQAAEVEINDYRCNIVDAKRKMDEKLKEYKEKKEREEQERKEKIDEAIRNAEIEREEKQSILGACQQDINNLQREINDLEMKRIEKERYITEQQENIHSKQKEIEAIQEITNKKLMEVRRQKQIIDSKFTRIVRAINRLNDLCRTSLQTSSVVARQVRALSDGNGSLAGLQALRRSLLADRHLAGDRRAFAARQRVVREIDALWQAAEERDRLQAEMRSGMDEIEKGYDGLQNDMDLQDGRWDDNNQQRM